MLAASAAFFEGAPGLVPQPSSWANPERSSLWASVLWHLLWEGRTPRLSNHMSLLELQLQVPDSGHPGGSGISGLSGKPWHRQIGDTLGFVYVTSSSLLQGHSRFLLVHRH